MCKNLGWAVKKWSKRSNIFCFTTTFFIAVKKFEKNIFTKKQKKIKIEGVVLVSKK